MCYRSSSPAIVQTDVGGWFISRNEAQLLKVCTEITVLAQKY